MQLDDYTPEKIKRKINGFLIFTILKLWKKSCARTQLQSQMQLNTSDISKGQSILIHREVIIETVISVNISARILLKQLDYLLEISLR